MIFAESTYIRVITVSILVLLLGCGQQQRLNTFQERPSIQHVRSTPEGYEIHFINPTGLPIIVWTNKNDPTEQYTVKPQTPMRLDIPRNRMFLRFAYEHPDRLGPISPWVEVTRVIPPPYPLVLCEPTSTGRSVSWQATHLASPYRAWLIRYDKRQIGPFSTEQRSVTIQAQTDSIWLQWVSDDVRGAFKEVSCLVDGKARP